jgi:hypothetical protein
MRITLLGNGRADFCSEKDYEYTLKDMGHEVVFLQETEANGLQIFNNAVKSDMFFWVHTHGWNTPGINIKRVLYNLKLRHVPTVSYHLDLWMGLKRETDLQTSDYFQTEYFFTVDKLMADYLNKKGVKAFYLPAGIAKKNCFIAEKSKDLLPQVAFIGSTTYHPEWPWRLDMLQHLKSHYGNNFGVYGKDTGNALRGKALNELYASLPCIVGDTLCKDFTYPDYFSDRLFETLGRGGVLVFPRISGNPYTEDEHYKAFNFGDFESLKNAINWCLENQGEARKMAKRAHEFTLENHTYHNRMDFITKTVA